MTQTQYDDVHVAFRFPAVVLHNKTKGLSF
jgi:hypothetical protein